MFYATICHVCKRFGDGVHLKRCSGCRMIAYCDQQHQKQHWKQHRPMCKAIQGVLQDHNIDRGETPKEWEASYDMKRKFLGLVMLRLGRCLELDESEMVQHPRECLVCHEQDAQLLEDCQKCAASFCKNHKDFEHKDICATLELCFRLDLLFMDKGISHMRQLPYLKHVSNTGTFQNMKDFIKTFGDDFIQTDSEMTYNFLAALHSYHLSRPLTLFHAMRLLNFAPKSKDLVIHIVGAFYAEEATLVAWEVLPRLIENVTSVMFIMIGPKLKSKFDPSRACDDCILHKNESFIIKYHDGLYENYVRNPLFVKPDLIVGFNFCVAELEIESKTTWAPSIEVLAKQNCPFILTFITLQDLKIETGKINAILDREVDHHYSGKNPFASLRPYRGLTPEYVFYKDQYLLIYRSLCL